MVINGVITSTTLCKLTEVGDSFGSWCFCIFNNKINKICLQKQLSNLKRTLMHLLFILIYSISLFCFLNLFQITELISTCFVLHLANTENQVTSRKILSIVGIAILHIFASGVDQFISNVFRGEGYPHQVVFSKNYFQIGFSFFFFFCEIPKVVRDLGFMVPDIMHLILPTYLLRQTRRESFTSRPFYRDKMLRKDVAGMIVGIIILFVICTLL
jgi:hypothetical protein